MNWTKERDIITPKCENFRDFGHKDKFSNNIKKSILENSNYSCRYCGGIYPKYLICTYIPSFDCNDACCRICYIITHLNFGLFHEIKLYYSSLPQLDIIRKSVDYIINNNEIPSPKNIDNDVKISPISLLEYINLLNCHTKTPNELLNYKIFLGNKLNMDFIFNNYSNKMPLFLNNKNKNKNNNDIDSDKFDETLENHIPTEIELNLFKIIAEKFPCDSPTKESI